MLNLNHDGWREIEGYEGVYQVHQDGYVRNSRGRVMKTYTINTGYACLKLTINGVRESFLLHRLVAAAFVENPEGLPIVNHRDGVKQNCSYKNLEWCNNSHNILHARETGLNPYNKPGTGHKFGITSQYRGVGYDRKRGKWYASVTQEGKCMHRKRFDSEIEAAQHYNWILVKLNLIDRPYSMIG